jgi:hypothetical protein
MVVGPGQWDNVGGVRDREPIIRCKLCNDNDYAG